MKHDIKEFKFSYEFKEAKENYIRVENKYLAIDCKLTKMVFQQTYDAAKKRLDDAALYVLEENRKKFFKICRYLRIDSIYVGEYELVTDKDQKHNGWPAVWAIDDIAGGITSGCGNHNQSQISGIEMFLPSRFYKKAYDVKTERQLHDLSSFAKYAVVERHLREAHR